VVCCWCLWAPNSLLVRGHLWVCWLNMVLLCLMGTPAYVLQSAHVAGSAAAHSSLRSQQTLAYNCCCVHHRSDLSMCGGDVY
jgi:hypothetical protein